MTKADKWLENIEKELETAKRNGEVSPRIIELVSELRIHQSELEMQNEELKESQEELSKLYSQYHELYDDAPIGYFILDKDGIIRNVNSKGAELLQLKKNQIIGRGFSRFIPKDYENKLYHSLASVVDIGEVQKVEIQLKRNETLFFAQIEILPLFNRDEGKYRINVTDINESKKAEEQLKESEQLYRTLFDVADEGFQVIDPIFDDKGNVCDFRYIAANPAFEKQTGIKTSEIIGRTAKEVFPTIEQYWIEMYTKVIKENKTMHYENYFDSVKRWYHLFYFQFPNGYIGVLFNDITKQKEIEEALKKSEQLYRTLFENTDDAFQIVKLICDKNDNVSDFRYLKTNKAFELQSGLKSSEILGKRVRQVLPDVEPYWFEMYDKVAKDSKPVHDINYNQDTNRWYDMFYFPYSKDEIGVLFRDITEQKKAEGQLKQLIEELERSNKELEQFAYVSSHDLQEPLRTIASFTQLLERRYKGQFDSDADEFIDFIVEAAIRMKAQIEGLLEYSRVETKGGEFQVVNMNEILKQTIKNLHTLIEEAEAEITVDELPNIMGDAEQLQRVFQNLISNAIRFRRCEEPLKIHISANRDIYNKEYVFSISDNGIGIEEQYSERIFTIFQRLHTRDVYHGTGIGLSIVKRVIERHGGHIWVESELDVGSTFYFTIPIEPVKMGGGNS